MYEVEYQHLNLHFEDTITIDSISSMFTNTNEVFDLNFKNVKVAFATNKFTILPTTTNQINTVFQNLGIDIEEDDCIETFEISDNKILYFNIDKQIKNYFEHRFRNVSWYFGDYGIIHYKNSKLAFQNHLAVNIYGNDLTIAFKKDDELLFFNKFYIEQKEDLLYYLKLAYEQLNLDANQFATYLYGFVEEKSPMYTYSFSYIRNYEIDRTLKHALAYMFTYNEHQLHYFYNLLALGK